MISNSSASLGSSVSASSTNASMFSASLWAGKKKDRLGTRSRMVRSCTTTTSPRSPVMRPPTQRSPALYDAPVHTPGVDQDGKHDQADRPPAQAIPLQSQCDEDHGERRKVVAEAVTELDPTLAEVHQVHERDGRRGENRSGDETLSPHRHHHRDGQEVRGRRQQDAHPNRIWLE